MVSVTCKVVVQIVSPKSLGQASFRDQAHAFVFRLMIAYLTWRRTSSYRDGDESGTRDL